MKAFLDTVLTPETVLTRLKEMAVFVAVEAKTNRIVGTISCNMISTHEGHLRGMAVLPEWQGSLAASKLLARGEQELREAGCSIVTLDTTQPLQRAIRFYEKNGFHRTGRIADFFGMPLFEYQKTISLSAKPLLNPNPEALD